MEKINKHALAVAVPAVPQGNNACLDVNLCQVKPDIKYIHILVLSNLQLGLLQESVVL